jgi:LacI family transcriptional regulator
MAAEYLISKGHRRLGFIGETDLPAFAFPSSDRRLGGYRAAIHDAGLKLEDRQVALTRFGTEPARVGMLKLLSLTEPPTAVFCASDTLALGALKAARERGVNVPRDMAVIGFDDIELAAYFGLTTIRQHLDESGRRAVELLMSRLQDPDRPTQHVRLPLQLVARETA